MATIESSRTTSATKPWWNLRYAWDHCPAGRSNYAQASASSLTAWRFPLGFPDTSMNPSCLPHAAGFPCQRMRSNPSASLSHHQHADLTLSCGLKVPVLFHHSTEHNLKTSVAYLYDFEQIGANFSCAFGSAVVYVLEWRTRLIRASLWKLKVQCLLPPSLAVGLLQSFRGLSEPAFSEIWLQPLIAFFFCPIYVV